MLDSLDTLIAFVLIMLVVSLLVTIVVQMISTALNLRGVNLAQGLKMTFGVIDSKSDKHAKELANYVLKGRYLSDSCLPDWPIFRWWRHATAVRPQEVFDAIQRIALGKESGDYGYTSWWAKIKKWKTGIDVPDLSVKAQRILKGLGISDKQITDAASAINRGEEVSQEFVNAAKASYERFDYWTCTCQERAQQWLTMHARLLTIIFATAAAIGLQLDSVEILKTVSSNKVVRDKLVAQAGALTSQADKVLQDSKSVLETAFKDWPDRIDPDVQPAIASITVEPNDTRETFTNRIEKALSSVPDKTTHLKSLNDTIDKVALETLKKQAGDYANIRADLDKTGFDLFPRKGWRWGENWSDGWTQRHRAGVVFSIILLSLGAPFWYSLLKNLVNLRSQVAQNISSEQQKQKPSDTSAPPPPPTPIPPAPSTPTPPAPPATASHERLTQNTISEKKQPDEQT